MDDNSYKFWLGLKEKFKDKIIIKDKLYFLQIFYEFLMNFLVI